MKYLTKKQIIKLSIGLPLLLATAIGGTIGINAGFNIFETYQASIRDAIAPARVLVDESESSKSAADGIALAKKITREGSVLVKNEHNALPFDSTLKKVNVFGHGSVDWVVGGSGSGMCDFETGVPRTNLLGALQNLGISYNTELSNYYKSFNNSDINKRSALNTFYQDFYKLIEPSLSESGYQTILNNSKNFSNTALVVLSRSAGESEDAPNAQYKYKYATDTTRHYFEISQEEEDLLNWVGDNFEKVVVLINSTNTMELGFLDNDKIDACLVVGGTGNNGAEGIVNLLWGTMHDDDYGQISVSPSGRLADTYPYSFDYNINANHAGIDNVNHYTNASGLYPAGVKRNAGVEYSSAPSYIDYMENIYVGYKWYETADAEGYWDNATYNGYDNVVQFPFGYGLSYTTFDWNVKSVEPAIGSNIDNNTVIKIKMSVKNVGSNFAGMDVVQAYVTVPYTSGGIEKSYVSLVGVFKTPQLNPGQETSDFVLEIKASDFESYDCYDKNNNGFKGYELESGTYQIKLMTNSHEIKNVNLNGSNQQGILNFNVNETIKVENDEVTGAIVKNLFTGDDAVDGDSIDGEDDGIDLDDYVSRENFPAISTTKVPDRPIGDMARAHNLYTVAEANAWDNATGNDAFGNPINNTKPNWGTGTQQMLFNGNKATALGLELGADYNDPRWSAVLDAIPFAEAKKVMNTRTLGSGQTVNSVGHTTVFTDFDGPAQINSFAASMEKGTGYPNATVLAQTFSPDLAYSYGLSFGTDMTRKGDDGVYGFGCNIHRSPFQGRNYEYLSEDGFLSGVILSNEVRGLANRGKYCFLKHLALAESEYEREAMYTYTTEQALREIYLKPFKAAIQEGNCVGLMTSYNRVGSTWAGASEALVQGVIRNEYGFNGGIITDYSDNNQYMNHAASFRVGGNMGMAVTLTSASSKIPEFANTDVTTSSPARVQNRMRDAIHQVLYMWLNPQYRMSIYVPGSDDSGAGISSITIAGWFWLEPIVGLNNNALPLKLILFGGIFIGLYFVIKPSFAKEDAAPVAESATEAEEKKEE